MFDDASPKWFSRWCCQPNGIMFCSVTKGAASLKWFQGISHPSEDRQAKLDVTQVELFCNVDFSKNRVVFHTNIEFQFEIFFAGSTQIFSF